MVTASTSSGSPAEQEKRIAELEAQVQRLKEENATLRAAESNQVSTQLHSSSYTIEDILSQQPLDYGQASLRAEDVERYSRQLLLKGSFGVSGQIKLLSSSVLVIGAGGIGSSVLLYLSASGVGRIRVMDFDQVEISNLHRQVIHQSQDVGMNKALSACQAVKALNPLIDCQPLPIALTYDNALQIISSHDCVVDASDNPQTRYLINDACVLASKPLISGSAIGSEGQLSVYNYQKGPCYRCLYPKPKVSAAVAKSCSDHGVLGTVPGMIGILQALETLKVLTNTGVAMHDRLLMYDALACSFMTLKKPKKQSTCPVCGPNATISSMEDSYEDSKNVRGPSSCMYIPSPIDDALQVSCADYNRIRLDPIQQHVLLDVRVEEQFNLCSLEGAVNIPLEDLQDKLEQIEVLSNGNKPVYCLCRRGVLSVEATKMLKKVCMTGKHSKIHSVKNIKGGLQSWRSQVDPSFPNY